MSDPVTNIEIEDVLSSIRRLVSSDERPIKTHIRPAEEAFDEGSLDDGEADQSEAEPYEPNKLVLTPSLRVDTPAPFVAEPADQVAKSGRPESDTSDDDHYADTADEHSAPLSRSNELKARVAELEEVVARQSDQWDPDGASSDANSGETGSPLPWEDDSHDSETADVDPAQDTDTDADPNIDDMVKAVEEAAGGADEDAADEASSTPSQATPEDDIPENFAADDSAQGLDDAPRAKSQMSDNAEFLSANDDFLDEDALRDLVADIVRQELQGALGERITRNVRKLVRREIHRAMASQELN